MNSDPRSFLLSAFAFALLADASSAAVSPRASATTSHDVTRPTAAQPTGFDAIHAPWTEVLAKHVRGGDFDYAGLAKDRKSLDAYIASLEAVKPEQFAALSKPERFAFWIDAYDAYTVKRVLGGYPVASIRDLGDAKTSVWDVAFLPLGKLHPEFAKELLTLNDVENRILRAEFHDARVHAALHGAAKGSPPLREEAFTGAKLDAQLREQVVAWLADASRNRFDRAGSKIELSPVFAWFAEDFQEESGSVRAWIARFRPDDAGWLAGAAQVDVKYLDYDWMLNDVKR